MNIIKFSANLWVLPVFLITFLVLPAFGQKTMEPPRLSFQLESPEADTSGLTITVTLDDKWHINAIDPGDEFSIPTKLTLTGPGLQFSELKYPPAISKYVKSLEQKLNLYEGKFDITTVVMKTSPDANFDHVKAELFYQACSDEICLRPTTLTATLSGKPVEAEAAQTLKDYSKAPEAPVASSTIEVKPESELTSIFKKNILLIFFVLIGWGLAMNLTPCVYPLLAVTISLFGDQGSRTYMGRLMVSLLYVLGIMITFSVLGILSALGGQLFGSTLQSPAAQLVISAVFIGLALSSFGLYEIKLPSSMMGKAMNASNTGGYIGGLIAGVFAGVLASPCIGPFILALIVYVAEQGSVVTGLTVFSIFSFGMGIPYIILGVASGLVTKLPRSGNWMIDVKKIMGIVLLVLALYYARGFMDPMVYELLFGIFLIYGGLYVNPFAAMPNISNWLGALVKTLALLVILYGVMSIMQGFGFNKASEPSLSASVGGGSGHIEWVDYSQELLQTSQEQGKPVIIDFESKIWCAACREMEEKTYPHPDVLSALSGFTHLKVDVDKHPDSKALQEKYSVRGIPTAILINPKGTEVGRVIGFVEPEPFLQKLKNSGL